MTLAGQGRRRATYGLLRAASALLLAAFAVAIMPTLAKASFPGSNGKIVFTDWAENWGYEVFIANPDGTGATNLTHTGGGQEAGQPAWSSDGKQIAFTTYGAEMQIYVMNADGTNVTQLTDEADASQPAWSPDGEKIAYERGSDIWTIDANGSNPTNLTAANGINFDADPAWSPDGKQIAFVHGWDIWVMDADGKNQTALVEEENAADEPDWSPSGSKIAFSSNRGPSGEWEIYTMDPNGANQKQLTSGSNEHTDPVFSPDGSKIIYSFGGGWLASINLDGTEQSGPLIEGGFQPDWQPLIAGHQPPTASFTASPTAVLEGEKVEAKSTATGGSSAVASQAWDLDDDGEFDDATGSTASTTFATLGTHTIRLSVVNSEGSRDAIAAKIEVVLPPTTAIDSGPEGTTHDNSPTFTFSGSPKSTFECRIDSGSFTPCDSPFTSDVLSDGAHVFGVRAKDANGHVDPTPASRAFGVDAIPETTISAGPSGVFASSSAVFRFTASESASFQCRIDGDRWVPCTSPWSYASLSNGSHSFEVAATDSTGNTDPTPAIAFWSIAPTSCHPLRLKGKTLRQAKAAIRSAGCKLAKIRKPLKVPKGAALVVVKSAVSRSGIILTLGVKHRRA
jgi:hypothetical protein